MTIGIDAHNLEKERTGVGRYLENLLRNWGRLNFPCKPRTNSSLRSEWYGASTNGYKVSFSNTCPVLKPEGFVVQGSAETASAVDRINTDSPAAQRAEGERSVLISAKSPEEPQIISNPKFILYFHKEIPKDDFLNNPIFEKRLLRSRPKLSFLIYFLFLLPFALKRDGVDLALFPGYMVPPTYWGKSVIVLHDVAFWTNPERFIFRYRIPYQLFSWFGTKISKKIITVSEFSKREILKCFKIKGDKISVIPLGIDEKFKVVSDEIILDKIKEKYKIKKHFVFQLGQIFYRRHVLETILAFEKIAKNLPDFQLLIVGKNWIKENLEEIIRKTNSKINREAIVWQKFVPDEDLVLLYNAASLTLYLSDYEGFGFPPLESMACGTPVLTTNFGSLRETTGDCGIIVKNPENIDEIAEKISQGLSDLALREKIIKKGFANVKKYSWERCAKETFNILLN